MPDKTVLVIDYEARDMARLALAKIDTHEQVCAVRWGATMAGILDVKRILGWGGGTLVLVMLGLIAWLANRAF